MSTAADVLMLSRCALQSRVGRSTVMGAGPAIAVAVVLGTFGVIRTTTSDIQAEIDRLGVRLITVRPASGSGRQLPPGAVRHLASIDAVDHVVPMYELDDERSTIRQFSPRRGIVVPLSGFPVASAPELFGALNLRLAYGRPLTHSDERSAAHVVVLGSRLAADWRRAGAPDTVTIDTLSFFVVGALAPAIVDASLDSTALIPVAASAALRSSVEPGFAYVTTTTATASASVATAAVAVGSIERPETRLRATVAASSLAAKVAIDDTVALMTYAVGALVALVGALAIANVQSVAVLERRSEIGIRLAMGHAPRVVAAQFIAEAVLVGLAGGVVGIGLGWAAALVWGAWRGTNPLVPFELAPALLAGSLLVAAVAGLVPAMRSLRQRPVDALRAV